ncbi:MAG: hypothetical protein U9R42_09110 [Bacteroidota bacterium]|nr:hypothetical protein [Bacteroidota bacterium]
MICNSDTNPQLHSIEINFSLTESKKKILDLLAKKKSTDKRYCIHYLAFVELNKFLYKIAAAFSCPVYLNYPIYIKFEDKSTFYIIETPSDSHLTPLKSKTYDYKDNEEYIDGGTFGLGTIHLDVLNIQKLNKINNTHIHLCYLYFTSLNEQNDKYFRLLSAWKYLEEFLELKGLFNVPQYQIPDKIFDDVFNVRFLSKKKTIGKNTKTHKWWIHTDSFSKKFLKDYYNEVRNLIAHHKRDSKPWISEKKYTPLSNINNELRMDRALSKINLFLSILNDNLFGVEFDNNLEIEKRIRKYIRFPKRL